MNISKIVSFATIKKQGSNNSDNYMKGLGGRFSYIPPVDHSIPSTSKEQNNKSEHVSRPFNW